MPHATVLRPLAQRLVTVHSETWLVAQLAGSISTEAAAMMPGNHTQRHPDVIVDDSMLTVAMWLAIGRILPDKPSV